MRPTAVVWTIALGACVALGTAGCSGGGSTTGGPVPTGSATADEKAPRPADLSFEIDSTGSRSARVAYRSPYDDETVIGSSVALPASQLNKGVDTLPDGWDVRARQSGGGRLTCVVRLGSEVVAREAASGSGARVTCRP